ncbi:MAG TPA: hypothetical protein VGQ44_13960 [Gemmatimonadaceae bacterium]|nr:hypothetical protein [Gemmatimonadaceae bacterium]
MRRLLVAGLATALACAGASPSVGSAPAEQHVAVPGSGTTLNVVATSGVSRREFAAPLDKVWRVLPAVFDSLSMPVSFLDPSTHSVGNRGYKVRGKLGKVGLARYIDCGTTQIGPNAESYDVTLTLNTTLTKTGEGATAMTIDFEASAKPMAFAQEPFRCSTKGTLEQRVNDLTAALVSR